MASSKEQSEVVVLRGIQAQLGVLADSINRHINETRESFHRIENNHIQTKGEFDTKLLSVKSEFAQQTQALRGEIQAVDSKITIKEASKETQQLSGQNARREKMTDNVITAAVISIVIYLMGNANILNSKGQNQPQQPQVIYMMPQAGTTYPGQAQQSPTQAR